MQTLRFYTKRIFSVVCVFFFAFLILLATRNSHDVDNPANYLPGVGNKGVYEDNHHPRDLQIHRPGEQIAFQPQVAPVLHARPIDYSDLNVDRQVDKELVERIQMHLKNVDLKSMLGRECKKNVTLEDFWLETQSRVVPKQDSWRGSTLRSALVICTMMIRSSLIYCTISAKCPSNTQLSWKEALRSN
uniref:Uncharacterized protein n=1 Tax=Ditylenchus dipsaci TaxID=166011 RepID=A0A915EJ57_9BILA